MCDNHKQVLRKGDSLEHGEVHDRAHVSWSRRQFLQGLGLATAGGAIGLSGSSVRAFGASPLLQSLARSGTDRILVLLQLSGGNDGLNTVIPYTDPEYYRIRPSIAISDNTVLQLNNEIGLHPSLSSFERLYHDGLMQVAQGVGYEDPSFSHFSSTDFWLSAGEESEVGSTGWIGRYLSEAYPEFVTQTPPGPLALQLGNGAPLLFQGPTSRMGMAFPNLALLNQFAEDGTLFDESFAPSNAFGSELSFMRSVANDSFQFAEAIQSASDSGSNKVEYPSTVGLSGNLAVTAKLIRGGLGANIYHLNLGGFDTHSNQLTRHASLMQQLSDAVAAFMDDLKADGWDQKVLVMTFSEFGRRIYQNGSGGTDHGTSAPIFMFGGGVEGGLLGSQPSLTDLAPGGNMKYDLDFRSIYGSVLKDWFGLSDADVALVMNGTFSPVKVIDSAFSTGIYSPEVPETVSFVRNYPNPFRYHTTIEFGLKTTQHVRINVFDAVGKEISVILNQTLTAGNHQIGFQGSGLPTGTYFVRVWSKSGQKTHKISVVR